MLNHTTAHTLDHSYNAMLQRMAQEYWSGTAATRTGADTVAKSGINMATRKKGLTVVSSLATTTAATARPDHTLLLPLLSFSRCRWPWPRGLPLGGSVTG